MSFVLVSGICFIFFFLGLQPGISLQDGGELAAAVAGFGVPHPPGYPLFVLTGQLAKILPGPDLAYRLNLLSALWASLAGGLLFLFLQKWLREICQKPLEKFWFPAAGGALFAIMGVSSFRQAVITEVYALNTLLVCLMLYCLIEIYVCREKNPLRARAFFWGFAFVFGLALGNHHTIWYFAVLCLVFGYSFPKNPIRQFRSWPVAFLWLSLALLVYLYIPWSAQREPAMNWGNPQTWENFWMHITRFQYAPHLYRSGFMAIEQAREQVLLLTEEYPPVLLLIGFIGLAWTLEASRSLFILILAGLLLSGPVTALVTNFEFPFFSRDRYQEAHYLVSVFFLPHYIFWGILMSSAAALSNQFLTLRWVRFRHVIPLFFFAGALVFSARTLSIESKASERAAENIFQNWEKMAGSGPAVVITNWDPFYFPSTYFQFVQGRSPQWIVLDIELMRAPWHLEQVLKRYPQLFQSVKPEIDLYLGSLKEVMAKRSQDFQPVALHFSNMLNAMIERNLDQMPMYLALHRGQRLLPPQVASAYRIQPQWVFARILKPGSEVSFSGPEDLDFSGFQGPSMKNDVVLRAVTISMIQLLLETASEQSSSGLDSARRAVRQAQELANRLGAGPGEDLMREADRVFSTIRAPESSGP